MTAMDKAGIGIAIGITIVAVAIASYGTTLQGAPVTSSFVAPPVTQPQPSMEKEESMATQKSMEEMMREQREQFMVEKESSVTVSAPTVSDVGPKTVTISNAPGSSVPGCEETNECYIPASVTVNVGDTLVWSNDDTAAHTVTSGTPTGGPDGAFDSGLLMVGTTFEIVADTPGTYDYFCMVHPWMVGQVTVN